MTGKPEKFAHLPLHASQAEVAQSLADLRTLWSPSPRQRAERLVADAKAEHTAAAEALLRGDCGAAARADAAHEALVAARARLSMLLDEEAAP